MNVRLAQSQFELRQDERRVREIKDRFGNPVKPREWFLVPLFVVDEAVKRIKNGSITQFVYDAKGDEPCSLYLRSALSKRETPSLSLTA